MRMCELLLYIEKQLFIPGRMGLKNARLMRIAGECCAIKLLIFLAYRDDAAEILRDMRKILDRIGDEDSAV